MADAAPTPHLISLKRQLWWWLLLPQLVLWAGGGLLAYRMALTYTEKAIDQSLSQSVRALARQVKPIGSGLLIDFPRAAQDVLEQDPDDRLSYTVSSPPGQFLLGNARQPLPPPTEAPELGVPMLYRAEWDGKPLRVVSLDVPYGDEHTRQRLRVQVGKSFAVQQRIAAELIADMLAPLLALGVLLSILVHGGIQRGLAPLKRLTAQLEHRSVNALSPIELTQAPREVHALALAVNSLLTEVARSVGQEKRFLNDAAHQLRTPLAGLISQVELAQHESRDPVVQARLLKVRAGAQRSAHLVHQLLTLARAEAPLRLQQMDLAQMAQEVARDWAPRAVHAGMDLGYEGEEHLPLQGDALQLREAVVNLLDNALRYTPKGSRITLRVSTHPSTTHPCLMVEDDGPGVAEDELQTMFQRFWRGNEQPGGCGLGLAIVQEIAHRHGGHAHAETLYPQGLRITLHLPQTHFVPA